MVALVRACRSILVLVIVRVAGTRPWAAGRPRFSAGGAGASFAPVTALVPMSGETPIDGGGCVVGKPVNGGTQDGPASHRRPLRVLPPQFVPMSPEQERQAVAALADLLLDYWNRHLAEHGSPMPP